MQNYINKKVFNINIYYIFCLFLIFFTLANYYTNSYINIKPLYYASFSDQFSYKRIDRLFNMQEQLEWVSYLLIPLLLLIRILFVSSCIAIACYLSEFKMSFKNIFRIVLVAEICLAIGMVVKIIWLTFMPINTLADIQYFSPLSLAQLLGPETIPKYLLYLCQTINIFEIAYWLVLSAGLVSFLGKSFHKMIKLVISSYGLGLLLWIIFVSYLTVTFSS